MDWYFFVPIFAGAATLVALVVAYLRPPTSSAVALKRRLSSVEADHETLSAKVERLRKRHYSLEGHVYGAEDGDDEDMGAPAAPNPSSQPGAGTLALIPDSDFPEDEFQAAVQRRRGVAPNA